MPHGVEFLETWIKDIALIEYKDLTPEEIEKDTETVSGVFYQLPKTKLIWIKLWTPTINDGHEWGTLRRYTPEKFEYYSKLVGQQVKIAINEN